MAGAMILHAVPITMEAVVVKHIQTHRFQNYHVLCFRGSIPEHCLHFFSGAAIVTLTIAAIGSCQRIASNVNGLNTSLCSGNGNLNNSVTLYLHNLHVSVGQNVDAGFTGIVDRIPEVPDHSLRIRKVYRMERLICILLHTKQNHAAQCIGKSRIGFPNASGQTAQSFLCFNSVVLPVLLNIGKVEHPLHLLYSFFVL